MNEIFYLLPLLLLLWGSVIFWRLRRQAEGLNRGEGLAACRLLLTLLADFQQHRGMSSGWLSGDRSFAPRLEGKARDIEESLKALRPLAHRESERPHPCLSANELALFAHRWANLRQSLAGCSVEQSITEHSELIAQLLRWLAAFGEARVDAVCRDANEHLLVRNYSARLPALTECLGQARAVGLSVATRGRCSAVARVKLLFLIARAERILEQALSEGSPCAPAEACRQAVGQLMHLVRARLLAADGVTISADAYFADATRAVDAVFSWIGEIGQGLSQAGSGSRHASQASDISWA
jgi:hypothetical protein